MIVEKKDSGFTCHMTEQEFVGIFRTVGGTNDFQRKHADVWLTQEESDVTHAAYVIAYHACDEIEKDR